MKRILILASLLLALGLVGSNSVSVLADDQCVPCNKANIGLRQLNAINQTPNWPSGFNSFNGRTAQHFLGFGSVALAKAENPQELNPEDPLQPTSGCYYQFTGFTTCSNHTMYGMYCYVGSWYCQLLGSCKYIAIGSCR